MEKAYDRLISHIKEGQRVLDIGCGTGALTLKGLRKGALVKGIDVNSQMLEIAQQRVTVVGFSHQVEFCELGVAELGTEKAESYDVVMSGLCFSELSENELSYTLQITKKLLKPDGLLIIGDEVKAEKIFKRTFYWFIRFPLVIITYLLTQTTTHAIKNLPEKVEQAGFIIESIQLNKMQSFIELIARKPKGGA